MIKKEYPPFLESLGNLRLPTKLDISKELNKFQK